MLQGEYEKARQTLLAAQRNDPENVVVRHNIDLIETPPGDGVPSRGR
jgi:Flp pilus assembly protein TadD